MKASKLFAAIAVFTSAFALPSISAAQETPPSPPDGLICNGVTCEGWIVIGSDPVTGLPVYGYIVLPDVNHTAPFPP